ncbi:hypothetical protein RP20_CCG009804 [Aedes albopictus]|nr:hypothetical protein RP20_CCG009804 [Aedes albopictus]
MALISPPSDHLNKIPRSLLGRLLFVERIVLSRNSSVLAVITADRQLLEVKERSIVACLDLGGGSGAEDVGRSVHEPPVVSSIFGTLSPKETDESKDQRIILTVFRSFDGSERKLFYLLELDRKLVVVEREQSPCVKFVIRETFEGFIKLLITERDDRVGCPVVKIYVEQQLEPIVTDFHTHRVESSAASVNTFTCFHEILKSLKERVNQRRAELAALQTVTFHLFPRDFEIVERARESTAGGVGRASNCDRGVVRADEWATEACFQLAAYGESRRETASGEVRRRLDQGA